MVHSAISMSARLRGESTMIERFLEDPLSKAVQAGRFTPSGWAGFLVALEPMIEAIDTCGGASLHSKVQAVWRPTMARSSTLKADLAYWRTRTTPRFEGIPRGESAASEVLRAAEGRSMRLLGVFYVMEGLALVGELLQPLLDRQFTLEGGPGASVLSPYGIDGFSRWREFLRRLDEAIEDPQEQAEVVSGAVLAFRRIDEIVNAVVG